MKCNICNTDADSVSLISGQGFACSEDCAQIAHGRQKAIHDELLGEEVGAMPDALETHDFERLALKFALHFIKGLSSKNREKISKANPIYLHPETLADDFKERILRHIKACYVSEIEFKGHDRMFNNGEYCFRQPVPSEHIIEACRKAQLIN